MTFFISTMIFEISETNKGEQVDAWWINLERDDHILKDGRGIGKSGGFWNQIFYNIREWGGGGGMIALKIVLLKQKICSFEAKKSALLKQNMHFWNKKYCI